jgi:hypothetical protein
MKMSILVSNINLCGQKDLSFKFRHKAYARPLGKILKKQDDEKVLINYYSYLLDLFKLGQRYDTKSKYF